MKYLIIEDEPLAQEELVRMLKRLDANFELLASIDSVKNTVEWLQNNDQPDIIFMDIHLSDNICFDIFNKVEVTAPVIFTTAYDQYAIEAFKTNGIAYLLKPIEEEELIVALKKFRTLTNANIKLSEIQSTIQQLSSEIKAHQETILMLTSNNQTNQTNQKRTNNSNSPWCSSSRYRGHSSIHLLQKY